MKKILSLILLAIVAVCCKTESDVEPNAGSFIRYFGSENNVDAKLALEAGGGYALLGNVEIQDGAVFNYKIRLIHTDKNGNLEWQVNYPAFNPNGDEVGSMSGASFIHLANSGYLIAGDRINADGSTDLLLLRTDLNGNMQDSVTISGTDIALPGASLHGHAVMQLEDSNGPYFVALGSIEDGAGDNDMFVGRFSAQDLSLEWKREYGAGSSTLTNRIYTNTSQNLFWAGSVFTSGHHDIRLVEAPKNSQSPVIGDPIVSPTVDEVASDFCQTVGGWAITGSSNVNGDEDIYILKVSNHAEVLFQTVIEIKGSNDKGNSICPGADGGLAILGTVASVATQQDLFLTKINAINGEKEWELKYGGADNETGASVRTTSDGSYLVFGTTSFGRARKLMLMKVNQNGQL